LFGITTFPTLLLLPGGPEAEGIVYDGEMKKDAMVAFLSQAAPPNPDPAPAKVKMPKKKDDKKAGKNTEEAKASFESASSSHASSEGSSAAASATAEEASQPTESPDPEIPAETPIILPEPAPPILTLATEEYLNNECLGERSGTCILAFVPATHDKLATTALTSLAEIAHKHYIHQRKLFPFYALPDDNTGAAPLKKSLGLSGDIVVIALNGRRGWWRYLEGTDMSIEAIENWVDAIRLGEGAKQKLPEGIVIAELAVEEPAAAEEPLVETAEAAEPAAEETADDVHDEL
jgi:protein disulfide-isomerase A6